MKTSEIVAVILAGLIAVVVLAMMFAYYFGSCDTLKRSLPYAQAPARCIR